MKQDYLLKFSIRSICLKPEYFDDHNFVIGIKFSNKAYKMQLNATQNINLKDLTVHTDDAGLRETLKKPIAIELSNCENEVLCKCNIDIGKRLDPSDLLDNFKICERENLINSKDEIVGDINLCLGIRVDYCKMINKTSGKLINQ